MAKRTSINIKGMAHGAPIPMGSKIGNMVYSSGIAGRDTEAGKMPESAEEQAVHMFKNIRAFMDAAGGTPDDIIQVLILTKDEKYREQINPEWLKMFPDEHSRPARHVMTTDVRGALFQAEIVAVLG